MAASYGLHKLKDAGGDPDAKITLLTREKYGQSQISHLFRLRLFNHDSMASAGMPDTGWSQNFTKPPVPSPMPQINRKALL